MQPTIEEKKAEDIAILRTKALSTLVSSAKLMQASLSDALTKASRFEEDNKDTDTDHGVMV